LGPYPTNNYIFITNMSVLQGGELAQEAYNRWLFNDIVVQVLNPALYKEEANEYGGRKKRFTKCPGAC